MNIEIKSWLHGKILFSGEFGSLKIALEVAVSQKANLSAADLSAADLRDADLRAADLRDANLRGANLRGADLSAADLSAADLRAADLSAADLSAADLSDANLRGADLSAADLRGADLSDANLSDANLRGADLRGADLRGAYSDPASPEEIARLDQVRAIVLAKPERLAMDGWHSGGWDWTHTPEEEHKCGSAHCIAGWLQALCPDESVRQMDPLDAGAKLAPASRHMFFTSDAVALEWLKDRAYAVNEGKQEA